MSNRVTTDRNDPVLSGEERAKGFVVPYRTAYTHDQCSTTTKVGPTLCATYATDPSFYGDTYCAHCQEHFPVVEFCWDGTDVRVGEYR